MSNGAKLEWDREIVPMLSKEELPERVVEELLAEGHHVFGKVEMS